MCNDGHFHAPDRECIKQKVEYIFVLRGEYRLENIDLILSSVLLERLGNNEFECIRFGQNALFSNIRSTDNDSMPFPFLPPPSWSCHFQNRIPRPFNWRFFFQKQWMKEIDGNRFLVRGKNLFSRNNIGLAYLHRYSQLRRDTKRQS